jgi:GGDEF domain-containing protein
MDLLDERAAPIPALAHGLSRMRTAEDRWREVWARPAADMPVDGVPPSAQLGKSLFDAYRLEQVAFASAVEVRTETLSVREKRVVALRVALELLVFTTLLIMALRQHRALKEAIVVPVAALLQSIGRVRDGELVTTTHPSGPIELLQLAEGLNDMVRALALARGAAESRDELLREHSDRLRQILDASRQFSESLNLAYVVDSVRSSTLAVGGYDQVVVWLMTDDQKGLRDAGIPHSEVEAERSIDSTVAWRAAKSGRMTFEGHDGRVRFGDAGAAAVRARAIPLIVGARVVGVLEARHGEARVASLEAVEILEMLAVHAATAIESARLNQAAEERSRMDALTRLHNRRRLDEDLDAECQRCARYSRPLAFVMLDVDHFKSFNDAHGHPQGDVALQDLAEVLRGSTRATDTAYRYGGEEFCVLLRETTTENAMTWPNACASASSCASRMARCRRSPRRSAWPRSLPAPRRRRPSSKRRMPRCTSRSTPAGTA